MSPAPFFLAPSPASDSLCDMKFLIKHLQSQSQSCFGRVPPGDTKTLGDSEIEKDLSGRREIEKDCGKRE